ncbi:hypothetical protein FACS189461_5630 [Spirochaetia bacterium]|nr:hypothetical protein FACS189461_5630 [Spirochaetia bacterium]
MPYASMVIQDGSETEGSLLDSKGGENYFTVHFPVYRSQFDDKLVQRLSLIVQREKPVDTKAYISFLEPKRKQRKITVITDVTTMGVDDAGISF